MSRDIKHIVIIGAGHAGGTAAGLLRQYGFEGEVTLVGDEPVAPYQRPPLSKAYLKGEVGIDDLKLMPDRHYEQKRIALRLGEAAVAIDRLGRTVTLRSGDRLGYDVLILATGSGARRLPIPGIDLAGIHELRTLADADALKPVLRPGHRLVVIGGGYIGLEVAASARLAGAEVTMLEREPRVLARVASPEISGFFQDYHRSRGARILTGVEVAAIEPGPTGVASAVRLADGTCHSCDAILVGVGAVATDGLARAAGLDCANGIRVDGTALSSDPAIYAIGDVTCRPLPLYGRTGRLESVGNALEQARQAACAILGRPIPPVEVPWFWSDQYDLKLQIAGLPYDVDRTILRGAPAQAKFAVFHLRGPAIVAVEAINAASEYVVGRRLIGEGRAVSSERLADPAVPMREVAV